MFNKLVAMKKSLLICLFGAILGFQPLHAGLFGPSGDSMSNRQILKLQNRMGKLNAKLQTKVIKKIEAKSPEKKSFLLPNERSELISILEEYQAAFKKMKEHMPSGFINLGSERSQNHRLLATQILYFGSIARLLGTVMDYSSIIGLFNELEGVEELEHNFLIDILWDFMGQTKRCRDYRRRRNKSLVNCRRPTIAELLLQKEEFGSILKHMKLPKVTKILIKESLHDYVFYLKKIMSNEKQFINNRYFFRGAIYKFKAYALHVLGNIYLPGKNLITDSYKRKIERDLKPGDICVVNRDYALSNIAFTGWWSHGLIHVGSPQKMTSFFENDEETNLHFEKKCQKENLNCNSFSTYLKKKYPKRSYDHANPKDSKWPNAVIEAVSDGVLMTPISDAFEYNRATCFRPKLSKREKAMAIEVAYSNVGKPYDFNFDARTYGRLACTELILWSYMPNPEENKQGLQWVHSVVMKIPAIYGFDVVKSHFKHGGLEFLFYYESGSGQSGLTEMTEEDLKKTVDL